MRYSALLLAVASLSLAGPATAADRGLLPQDFYREATVTETSAAPGGDLVAFTVMTIDEEKNARHSEIWMQSLTDGRPSGEPFRFTSPASRSSGPRWSPDGELLSFQSKRGSDENETWFIRVTAPGGEAFHIDGVDAAPVWSPDGLWIAFLRDPEEDEDETPDEPSEDSAESAAASAGDERKGWIAPDAVSTTLDEKRFDGRVVTTMRLKRDGTRTLLPHRSAQPKSQLFVVAAQGGEARQLTDLPFTVRGAVWAGDNANLLFVGDELEDDEHNRDYTSEIYRLSVDGGEPRKLTSGLGREGGLAVSRDGRQLGFVYSAQRGAPSDLMVVDLALDGTFRSAPRNLTERWDLSPGSPRWTADGTMLCLTQIGGNRHLFEIDTTGRIDHRAQGDRSLAAVSVADSGLVAYAASDPSSPAELYISAAGGESRLTSFNREWLEDVTLMPSERLTWTVSDGTAIEGWLVKPVGYTPGESYPMILKIHGGPHGAYGNTWFRTFHVLSSAGFFVLYTNPRGSTGYGHDFTYATLGRWGEMDSEDYLSGIDAALARYPDIDTKRIGVSGGSYGGFMTAWLSATTDRFAVANASRMIVNWESWYGTSDAQGLTEHEFEGEPWERREIYRRLSPITYVENVTAPTLIIHSEDDFRTPIGDGEQWFMALKKRRVPVEMVRYPRSSHGLSRSGEPWLLVDRLERIRSWFVHWLVKTPGD